MKRKLICIILLLILFPVISIRVNSQNAGKIYPYIQLKYLKNTDDHRILQATLAYSANSMELPLSGMELNFYNGGDQKKLISKVLTDRKGAATLDLGGDIDLKAGKDGRWTFTSEFAGNDTIEGCSSDIAIRDMKLEMTLSEADSIKTITLKGSVDEGGSEKPVTGEIVKVYVPRMFSPLPIGEVKLDEAGKGSIVFPSDLPGDKAGNLEIIARIEENEKFGNVEKRGSIKWGVPTDYSVPVNHRALWTKIAPKWMIYTLSVLLAGVWGHYLFAIISLIRIKIDADRKRAREEFRL